MPFPILTRNPLVPIQGILGVRGGWEGPFPLEIGAKANDDHALAALRDAVVSGVQQSIDDAVEQPVMFSLGVVFLKSREMVRPVFTRGSDDVWIRDLKNDVF